MATKADLQEEINRLRDESLKQQLDNIEVGMNGNGHGPERTYGLLRPSTVTFADRVEVVRNRLNRPWDLTHAEALKAEAALSSVKSHVLQAEAALQEAERVTSKKEEETW